MRGMGTAALIFGALFGLYALNMRVSVETSYGAVNNLGLMNDRQNYLIVAGVAVIAGILLLVLGISHQAPISADPFEAADQAREMERKRYAFRLGVSREAGVYHYGGGAYPSLEEAISAAEAARQLHAVGPPRATPEELERGRQHDRIGYSIVFAVIVIGILYWIVQG